MFVGKLSPHLPPLWLCQVLLGPRGRARHLGGILSVAIRAQLVMFWLRTAYLEKNVELRVILGLGGSLETSWVGQLLLLTVQWQVTC